jgi:hypothetical protein
MAFTRATFQRILIVTSISAAITACNAGHRRDAGTPAPTTADMTIGTFRWPETTVAPTTMLSVPASAPPTTTTPQTTRPTVPAQHVGRCVVEPLIREIWTADTEWALRIAWRESRCVATARNRSGSSGIFQLQLPLHNDMLIAAGCRPEDWSIPSCNIRAAWLLYQGAGRRPWRL